MRRPRLGVVRTGSPPDSGQPTRDTGGVGIVLGTEQVPQGRLLVTDAEQVNGDYEADCIGRENCRLIEKQPVQQGTKQGQIHRIPRVSIRTLNREPLGRVEGQWRGLAACSDVSERPHVHARGDGEEH